MERHDEPGYVYLPAAWPMNRGNLLILLMVTAGLAAGALKIWKQHQHMDQVLAAYSPQVVRLIAEAPQVELLKLEPISTSGENGAEKTIEIAGEKYEIIGRKNVASAKGFVDVRDRLVDDASYSWNAKFDHKGFWKFVLLFSDGNQQARIAFSISRERVAYVKALDDGPTISARPIADGLESFFAAQFADAAPPARQ
jgi:hypothetical protein